MTRYSPPREFSRAIACSMCAGSSGTRLAARPCWSAINCRPAGGACRGHDARLVGRVERHNLLLLHRGYRRPRTVVASSTPISYSLGTPIRISLLPNWPEPRKVPDPYDAFGNNR